MENLKMHTPDLADENFKKLAALFPKAVTETKEKTAMSCVPLMQMCCIRKSLPLW